jgi:hypothetical protein
MNFNEAKSALETITEVIKKSATLDLQEKIISLREYIISLKDENISLKEENQDFKLRLGAEQDFDLQNGLYWKAGDDVPFCQKCLDGSQKRIHLQAWSNINEWKCFECNNHYSPPGQAGKAKIYRPGYRKENHAR